MQPVASARGSGPVFGLDVVRAVAIILVLLSHCGDMFARWCHTNNIAAFSYGAYYGIELFYVLSGLLIGGLLIAQLDRLDQPRRLWRSWWIFMARRWLRTLPLYYVWFGVLAVGWAPILWPAAGHMAGALLRFGTLTQNLAWVIRDGNFFDVSWSLAVEEWFYLGFSALLLGLAAWARQLALPTAIMVFLLGPVASRCWFAPAAPAGDHLVIYWLDSIAIGVIAAWMAARQPRAFRAAAWLLPIGAALVWLSLNGGLGRLGVPALWRRAFDVDLIAFGLVLALPAASRWRTARGPAASLVRAISRYSYALYLTHLSVLIYIDAKRAAWHLAPAAAITLSLMLIATLSIAMSRWIERPIMARRPDDRGPHDRRPHGGPIAAL